MNRVRSAASVELAQEKLAEAEFFLSHLERSTGDAFAVRCLFSATASAAYCLDPSKSEPVEVDIITAMSHLVGMVSETISDAVAAFPHHTRAWLLEAERRAEGLSVEDVEEQLGFPRGWSYLHGATEEQRLAALRGTPPPPVLDPRFEAFAERFLEHLRSEGQEEWFRSARAYPD